MLSINSNFFESLHKEQWKEVRLGEIAEIKTDIWKVGGEQQKQYIGLEHIAADSLRLCGIGNSNEVSSNKYIFKENDILFGKLRPYFRKIIKAKFKGICSTDIWVIRAKQNIDQTFLFYFFTNKTLVDLSYSSSKGTRMPRADWNFLSQTTWLLPPIETQRKIAEILSSFDDKIDLLTRQNKTLESLALTLFYHTFIDNPNRDEWEEIKIDDYVECVNGYSYKSNELNKSNIALVTLKNFARDGSFNVNGFKEFIGTKFKDSQIVKNGDLVVAHTDITQEAEIIGNPALIIDTGKYKKLVITMDLVKVESKSDWISKEFLYYLFKTQDFKSHCLGNSNGTTVLHMNRKTIAEYTTKIPNSKVIMDFTKHVSYFFGKTYNNLLQIQSLQSIRDVLLSKILNDKMEV